MRRLLVASLMSLLLPAVAAAQDPAPAGQVPAPSVPIAGKLELALLHGVYRSTTSVAVRGAPIRVRGTLAPFVEGQTFVVRVYRNGRKIAAISRTAHRATVDGQVVGRFAVTVRSGKTGRVEIRASHRATDELATVVAPPRRFTVSEADVGVGAKGPLVRFVQRQLVALHFTLSSTGTLDPSTGRALMAYRKLAGMTRVERLSPAIVARLAAGKGGFHVRYPDGGKHVEASISKQVLALINPGGKVWRILPLSSGAPATPTVLGRFRFYSKTPGTNAKGMVDSNYFIRGYAIHGYASVPPYNASHGCLRIPIPNARMVFNWVRLGDRIDVYR